MEQFEQQRESEKSNRDEGVIKKSIKKGKGKKQQVNDQKVEECSICYGEIIDKGIIQTCQHTYCFDCIEIWAKQNKTCPQCRVQFSQILRLWKQGKRKRQKTYDYPGNRINSDDGELLSLNFYFQSTSQMPFFQRFLSLPFENFGSISSDSE
ncbi:unnamed protein product [Paramecium sonneborni]|uniref:RING-type domain-containing protein n=1 Tax=Paramecium sonneborni TaxID=65129 RepID=A0A8S1M6S0_9CILI|nr:unnamed protein product [Paramecium sonneborni]